MSVGTTIIAQDYLNVFELFDVARTAAHVEGFGYTTWLDGTVRTLRSCPGAYGEQIIQRYDASGGPYPVEDDLPHGWATVTFTTNDYDWSWRRHGWFSRPHRTMVNYPARALVLAARRRGVGRRRRVRPPTLVNTATRSV